MLILALAGVLVGVGRSSYTGQQSPRLPADPTRTKALSGQQALTRLGENGSLQVTIDPVWTRVSLSTADGDAKDQFGFSVAAVGGAKTDMAGSNSVPGSANIFARNPGAGDNSDEFKKLFLTNEAANNPFGQPVSLAVPAAPYAPPNLTLTGTCDTFGNSVFTIKNLGGAMTTNYTWELYQNSVFLTSGTFLL